MLLWLIAAGLQGCSLEDDRDLCCRGMMSMQYVYRPYGQDQITDYITSLRHYLYTDGGDFVCELPPGADFRYQPLDLPEGCYAMVTVGNSTERATSLGHPEGTPSLDALRLDHIDRHTPDGPHFGNTDELYWGAKRFVVDADGKAVGIGRSGWEDADMVTQMNNIHCHLRVRVEWSNAPPYIGTYDMELEGVATGYSLHPDRASEAEGFIVPRGDNRSTHRISVPLRSRELDGEFVTLRYEDGRLPVLRILFGGEKVSPDIDLAKAFKEWGLHPSRTHVQKYKLLLQLRSDGSAFLYPSLDGSIEDWIDGGSFG